MTNRDNIFILGIIGGFAVGLGVMSCVSAFYIKPEREKKFEQSAIDAGVGEYKQIDPRSSEMKFQFITNNHCLTNK